MKFKLIIALGNPGKEYEKTPHNAGWLFADYLTTKDGVGPAKHTKTFSYQKTNGPVVVKPLTFMNESGAAAKAALEYFQCSPDAMLIAHDDSDILMGNYKLSFDRGAAGHKGVESIMHHLPGAPLWRLRIGIRPPTLGEHRKKAGEFVLTPLSAASQKKLQEVFSNAESTIEKLMTNDAPSGPETI